MSELITAQIRDVALRARVAARVLATTPTGQKNAALEAMAQALVAGAPAIVAANEVDVAREQQAGMSQGLVDRLRLTTQRLEGIAAALRELIALPDPVGEVMRGSTLPNGLVLRQVRVPMGVVGMIYEARPNVTVDAAGLGLKSGNAVILRGGSAALESNTAIVRVLGEALEGVGLPRDVVQSIDALGREGAVALMRARGLVDVLVPRGGAGLISTVVDESRVPVIETGTGNCHIYLHADARLEMALPIVLNSKTQRVGVCNAAETLLVHRDAAPRLLPGILAALADAGVRLHADAAASSYAPAQAQVTPATAQDWATEYLDYDIAVGVVDSLEAAIDHIQQYTTGHTEAIVTESLAAAQRFISHIDAAVINVNASTRFTDGGMFGLGAEIGISTQKLHARGPMGLAELTTSQWIVVGEGQIRQ